MHIETIKSTDFNGVERTNDYYFNLTKAEVMEMEMGTTGGYAEMLQQIIKAQDTPSIIKIFKELILKAYGIKSPDGLRFIKNDEIREEFSQTQAYSELFMKLALDADAASKFVNGIMPADLANDLANKSAVLQKVN